MQLSAEQERCHRREHPQQTGKSALSLLLFCGKSVEYDADACDQAGEEQRKDFRHGVDTAVSYTNRQNDRFRQKQPSDNGKQQCQPGRDFTKMLFQSKTSIPHRKPADPRGAVHISAVSGDKASGCDLPTRRIPMKTRKAA